MTQIYAPPQPATAAIALHQLQFSYADCLHTLQEVDLKVNVGERVGIIGPNGAGKTTLFHLMCGVLTPTVGEVVLFGDPVHPGAFRPDIGLVFQNPDDQLFCTSVWEDVAFGPQNMGYPQRRWSSG